MRSLFFYDTRSTVFWRCSALSTLGRQSYRRHGEQLDAFFRELYASLDHESNRAGQATRNALQRYQRVLPAQLAFLRHPRPATFVAALRLDPDWAVRMLASVVVNRLKKH